MLNLVIWLFPGYIFHPFWYLPSRKNFNACVENIWTRSCVKFSGLVLHVSYAQTSFLRLIRNKRFTGKWDSGISKSFWRSLVFLLFGLDTWTSFCYYLDEFLRMKSQIWKCGFKFWNQKMKFHKKIWKQPQKRHSIFCPKDQNLDTRSSYELASRKKPKKYRRRSSFGLFYWKIPKIVVFDPDSITKSMLATKNVDISKFFKVIASVGYNRRNCYKKENWKLP